MSTEHLIIKYKHELGVQLWAFKNPYSEERYNALSSIDRDFLLVIVFIGSINLLLYEA